MTPIKWHELSAVERDAEVGKAFGVAATPSDNWAVRISGVTRLVHFESKEVAERFANSLRELRADRQIFAEPESLSFKPYSTSVDACLELAREKGLAYDISRGVGYHNAFVKVYSNDQKGEGIHREDSSAICIALLHYSGATVEIEKGQG